MKRNYLTMTLVAAMAFGCWLVNASAADDAKTVAPSDTTGVVTPGITYAGVSGNASKFREDTGIKDGWTGGIVDFKLSSKVNKDTALNIEGRGLFDAHDYKLQLELVKPELYFVRAGYTEWRKYYNDMGGYYPTNNYGGAISIPNNQDLHVDMRKIFFEAGLTMPNLPKVIIGYERQEKEGMKSMLEWGSVYDVTNAPATGAQYKIYPSFKAIDERTDIVKMEMEYDIKKIHIGDEFRYEHFQANDTQYDQSAYYLPPYSAGNTVASLNKTNSTQTYQENYKNDLFSNTFHVDSQVNEKFYWSMGYMFNRFDGGDGIQDQVLPSPATPQALAYAANLKDTFISTSAVDLNSDSHVLNANLMYEPCKNVIMNAGIQGEYSDQSAFETGYRSGVLTNSQIGAETYITETDKRSLNETFGIRYVGLPFTTIYAEGNLVQEQTYYNWDLANDPSKDQNGIIYSNMVNQLNSQRQAVKVGFSSSPISRLTLSAYYRHTISEDDYDYGIPSENLFNSQRTVTDEFVSKLTLRPNSRVMVALQYQLAFSDISLDAVQQTGQLQPSPNQCGHYESSTYTLSTTIMPINRLYLTGLVSYQDTITECESNGALFMAPYRGNVYTALASIGYAIDNKTDITVEYDFTYQDNFNYSVDLNGGYNYLTDDHRHIVKVGLKRKIVKNITGNLRYEYYENVENSTGGINNYRANIVSASCAIRF